MEQELIDAILQRQSSLIGELVNKNIFLESKVLVLERHNIELKERMEKDQAAKKISKAA